MKRVLLAACVLLLAIVRRSAQTYPSRPITMVVPFGAGGPTDALARIVAQRMSATLGQTGADRERHRGRPAPSGSDASRARRRTATRS